MRTPFHRRGTVGESVLTSARCRARPTAAETGSLTGTQLPRDTRRPCGARAVSLAPIAREAGTPPFVYSAAAIREQYGSSDRRAGEASTLGFTTASRRTPASPVLALLRELGAGLDIVSGGELYRALSRPDYRRRTSSSAELARPSARWKKRCARRCCCSTSSRSRSSTSLDVGCRSGCGVTCSGCVCA